MCFIASFAFASIRERIKKPWTTKSPTLCVLLYVRRMKSRYVWDSHTVGIQLKWFRRNVLDATKRYCHITMAEEESVEGSVSREIREKILSLLMLTRFVVVEVVKFRSDGSSIPTVEIHLFLFFFFFFLLSFLFLFLGTLTSFVFLGLMNTSRVLRVIYQFPQSFFRSRYVKKTFDSGNSFVSFNSFIPIILFSIMSLLVL